MTFEKFFKDNAMPSRSTKILDDFDIVELEVDQDVVFLTQHSSKDCSLNAVHDPAEQQEDEKDKVKEVENASHL